MNVQTRELSSRDRRRGLISVAVLIALIVIGLVCAGLLKVALVRRAEVGREERRLQVGWLADSGRDRAETRLRASKDYVGEIWEIPAEDLGGRGSAEVAIRIERLTDRPDRAKVHVQADYPARSSLRARQTREFVVSVPPPAR